MLSDILTKSYYNNTVQDWIISFSIILASIVVGKILYWFFGNVVKKLTAKTETKIDDIIIDMIEEPIVFALTIAGIWFAFHRLHTSDIVQGWFWTVYQVLILINVAWLITRLFDAIIEEYLVPLAEASHTDLDDQLLPILRKGVKIIIWVIAFIVALNNAGYNVGALLAGLGIGGIAFALAAKDTISNIFGGFTIFTDKPFKIKDRIKTNGYDGTVEEIGLRSTRIRTLEGRQVTIPNSKFAESPVENITREPARKIVTNLGLTYNTTPQKMELAIKILEKIAQENKSLDKKPVVTFNAFNDSSMNIQFIYYIKKDADFLQVQSAINMEILKQFNKNKLDFAFPTRTIYTKR